MITTKPAMIRVDTRYEIDLMPITSSASISSLMRMAPKLGGGAGADDGRERDTRHQWCGDAHVDQCGEEAGERLDADVAQRREALDRDQR